MIIIILTLISFFHWLLNEKYANNLKLDIFKKLKVFNWKADDLKNTIEFILERAQ